MTDALKYLQSGAINIEDLRTAYLRERCRRDFFFFVQTFWETIINEPPVFNWHIPFLCNELQELSRCIIERTPKPYDEIINIPPGTTKSTIATVMFHPWLWAIDGTIRIITNSYSEELSIEHATKSRDIITSDLYKKLFPEIKLRRDKSAKMSYENTLGGARYTTSTGGTITGKHAHLIINDDPISPGMANSEVARLTANEHTKTLSTRKVDKKNTPTLVIMQRLHEMDVTGYLLAKKGEHIRHICLPGEITPNAIVKPDYLREKYIDGLLDPIRLDREVLAEMKVDLGSRQYAGQVMQTPIVDGGNIVQDKWFQRCTYQEFTSRRDGQPIVFFLDTAYTSDADNDPSGIIATCKIGNDLYITKATKVYLKFPDLIRWLPGWVNKTGYRAGSSMIRIEPKANGISVIDQLRDMTSLNVTRTPSPTESKETRLHGASPTVEAGRVILVEDESWNDDFIAEICGFPAKAHDEYVDLLCYAVDYHIRPLFKTVNLHKLAQNLY